MSINELVKPQDVRRNTTAFWIGKSYRGKGIGGQLLSSAIEKSRQLGCCEVEVSTEKTNIKAREFYKQYGFTERGVLFEIDLWL